MKANIALFILILCASVNAEYGKQTTHLQPIKILQPSVKRNDFAQLKTSTAPSVLAIKDQYRADLDRISNSCHGMPSFSSRLLDPFPYERLSDSCKMIIAEVFGMPQTDPDFRERVLTVLGRTVGGGFSQIQGSAVSEALAYMATILTDAHGTDGQVVLNYLNRRIFAGFSNEPLTDTEFEEMRNEAIKIVGANTHDLAHSDEMTRSLRSLAYSSCSNLEAFSNLSALLLKYTNTQRPCRECSKSIWTAAFATVLKLTHQAIVQGHPTPEQEAFLFFYKQDRFAETYDKLLKSLKKIRRTCDH